MNLFRKPSEGQINLLPQVDPDCNRLICEFAFGEWTRCSCGRMHTGSCKECMLKEEWEEYNESIFDCTWTTEPYEILRQRIKIPKALKKFARYENCNKADDIYNYLMRLSNFQYGMNYTFGYRYLQMNLRGEISDARMRLTKN